MFGGLRHWLAHNTIDYLGQLQRQQRRHGVADLMILIRPWAFKKVVVRKCLQSCRFSNRKATAFRRVRVDEIVTVLVNMRRYCRGWAIGKLNPKPVRKVTFLGFVLSVFVFG